MFDRSTRWYHGVSMSRGHLGDQPSRRPLWIARGKPWLSPLTATIHQRPTRKPCYMFSPCSSTALTRLEVSPALRSNLLQIQIFLLKYPQHPGQSCLLLSLNTQYVSAPIPVRECELGLYCVRRAYIGIWWAEGLNHRMVPVWSPSKIGAKDGNNISPSHAVRCATVFNHNRRDVP